MTRLLDPLARTRTYAARRAGMLDGQKVNRRLRRVESALAPSISGGDEDVADTWTPVEVVTQLPAPTVEVVGRVFVVQSEDAQDTINVGLTSADGTPILVGLNVLGADNDEYVLQYFFGIGGSGNGQFNTPSGIAVDSNGNIFVVDPPLHRVQKFDKNGSYISQFGGFGSGSGQFNQPRGIAIDSSDNILVTDLLNNRVQKFSNTGVYQSHFGASGSGNGQFALPVDVAIDASGNIYVSDFDNYRVQKFTSSGVYSSQFGTNGAGNGQFNKPYGIALDAAGNIYVSDTGNNRVQKFTSAGAFTLAFGSSGNGDGQFSRPYGVVVDNVNDIVYVADNQNGRIQFFSLDGDYVGRVGSPGSASGQLNQPVGLDIDGDGRVYITEWINRRISKLDEITPGITVGESGVIQGAGITSLDFAGGFDVTVVDNEANIALDPVSTTITARSNSVNVSNATYGSVTASCISGEVVTGGGFGSLGFTAYVIHQSQPSGNGWACTARNDTGGTRTLTCYALCLSIS